MSTQFTPGPWVKDRIGQLRGADGKQVEVWDAGIAWADRSPTTEANADLIAAAPDLYAALEAASTMLADKTCDRNGITAALAKARGE